jgi:hypothetical protein
MRAVLESAQMDSQLDPARMDAVRQRMVGIATAQPGRARRYRRVWVPALALFSLCGIGLAATETGRQFVRSIFTPVETFHSVEWEAPDGGTWMRSRNSGEFSPEEEKQTAEQFGEIFQIKQAGGGQLVGLMEGPDYGWRGTEPGYLIAYTLSNGEVDTVGGGQLTEKQAANMRIDEIMQLRDSGAGEIIDYRDLPIGLGHHTIRFTLPDGQTVDLTAWYPPSTRAERDAIFDETRELKDQLRFTVDDAFGYDLHPGHGTWGLLRYALADGRVVGIIEQIPEKVVSPDGTQVEMPEVTDPLEEADAQ